MAFDNPVYQRLFALLLQNDGNLYFHCTAGKDRTGGRIFDHDGSGDGLKGCSERISVVQSVLETGISPASSNPCFAAIYTGAKNQISLQNILGHQFYGMKTWQYANNQPAEYGWYFF